MEMRPDATPQAVVEAVSDDATARPVVYTYFQAIDAIDEAEQLRQIEVWKASWERYGWQPIVLVRADCDGSGAEKAAQAESRFRTYPSANPDGYDLSCYMRWVAFQAVGGGLMTDYDVVNVGFRQPMLKTWTGPQDIYSPVCLCRYWVPAVVWADGVGARTLAENLLAHKADRDAAHISDMGIFQQLPPGRWTPAAREWHEPDEGQRLVHCATSSLRRGGVTLPKSTVMRELMERTVPHV